MRCGRRWRRNCRSAARGFSGVLPQAPELSQRQRVQQDRARHRERRNHDGREGPELRDLFREGPRKFADFERSLTGISATTLSARLKKLVLVQTALRDGNQQELYALWAALASQLP